MIKMNGSTSVETSVSPPADTSDSQPKIRYALVLSVGAVCSALVCVLVTWSELVIQSIRVGFLQLPPISITFLALIMALGSGMTRLLRRRAGMNAPELAVVYIMCLMAAMVSSHGIVEKWLPLLVVPNYYATALNGWNRLFSAHFPAWMVPYNPLGPDQQQITQWYYEGLPRDVSVPWAAWILPVCTTGALIGCVVAALLFLASLMRKQWVETERLAFPLAQLPIDVIGDESLGKRSILVDKRMWFGALVPIVVYSIDWAHQLAPGVPQIPTSFVLNTLFTAPPLNQLGLTPMMFSYAAIGFFFLLPADILLSIWLFFLLGRLQQLAAITYNLPMPVMPLYPTSLFLAYQSVGANFVLAAFFLYTARPHVKSILKSLVSRHDPNSPQEEMIPYKSSVIGLIASLLGACVILHLMGMAFWLALLEVGGFVFVIAIVMARAVAEGGLLMTETSFRPIDVFRVFGNVHDLGPANLSILAFFDGLMLRDQRGLLLTGMLDAACLADAVRLPRRTLTGVLVAGIAVALAVAVPYQIYVPYHVGALKMDPTMMAASPSWALSDYQRAFAAGGADPVSALQERIFLCVGVVVTTFLCAMRASFYWWPLHPLGYALASTWSALQFWFPCLVAWILKSATLHYGGGSAYQKARPFFIGLVIGEFGMAVLSVTVNIIFHAAPPPFPWW